MTREAEMSMGLLRRCGFPHNKNHIEKTEWRQGNPLSQNYTPGGWRGKAAWGTDSGSHSDRTYVSAHDRGGREKNRDKADGRQRCVDIERSLVFPQRRPQGFLLECTFTPVGDFLSLNTFLSFTGINRHYFYFSSCARCLSSNKQ